ncbi:MAG TPA: hypothetical protein VMV18_14250 [bacterium]|nr:hypothetical protein [bacterium]
MRRTASLLGVLASTALVAAAACGRSGFREGGAPTGSGTTPPASPTPTNGVPAFGDGHSGPLTVATSQTVTPNTCHVALAASGTTIGVDSATGLTAGDAILVWQVQDDIAADNATTPLTVLGSAGRFEVARIAQVSGTNVKTAAPLTGTYASAGTRTAQLCTVPEYTTVMVQTSGAIRATAWNGATGAVVAFFASGQVTIGGAVDAAGLGFRGGDASQLDTGANTDTETLTSTDPQAGGGKGEGLDARGFRNYARGNIATGAGGGNPQGGGGAGGGNGGAGGAGGDGEGSGNGGVGGVPGRVVVLGSADRLLAGGGGGGGQDHFGGAVAGANGGGVVFLRASSLSVLASGRIDASGLDGLDSNPALAVPGDGAGGGGAGGTVLVTAGTGSASAGRIAADGGGGGLSVMQGAGNNKRGPGGGAGGGFVHIAGVTATGPVSATHGTHGTNVVGAAKTPTGDDHNALDGADGIVVEN